MERSEILLPVAILVAWLLLAMLWMISSRFVVLID